MTNLVAFYNEVTSLVDKWKAVDVVYLKFNKAFDTISHNNIMDKLIKYGLDK